MLTAFHLNQLQQNQVYPGEGTCHILVDGPKEGNMEHQCYRNDICRYHQVSSISLCSIQEIFVSETPAKGNSIVSCTLLICTHWQISSNFNIAAKLCDHGWWSCYYQILVIPILRTCLVFPKNINWKCWFYDVLCFVGCILHNLTGNRIVWCFFMNRSPDAHVE